MFNFYRFKEYNKYLLDKRISKPHKNSRYATQGVTKVNNEIFITYYDTDNLKNSIIDIVKKDSYTTLELDNKSHVGGISYSDKINSIFVSNNTFVNLYKLDDINALKHGDTLRFDNKIKVHEDVGIASYLTVYSDNLYVGKFDKNKATKLAIYDITDNGILFNKLVDVPFKKVQGMCIYKYNDTLYYLFSRSYGRRTTSNLLITKLVDNKLTLIKEFFIPCMAEQISISDESLMIVFESDCSKFNETFFNSAKTRINSIIYLDIEKILADC